MKKNKAFLDRAEAIKPRLIVTQKELIGSGRVLKAGDDELLDFGDHYTGCVTVTFESAGLSPYGGKIIRSICHAWSCMPAYFLRKYYSEG